MRSIIISIAIILLSAGNPRAEDADSHLLFDFDAALVEITPRPPGRTLIRLPSITFTLRVEPRCAAGLDAESVSISVADTRLNLGREALLNPAPGEAAVVARKMRIPRSQIGPVAIEDFCIAGEAPNATAPLRVHDALSAQLSLRCGDESRQSIVYQTVALEVTLSCKMAASDQLSVAALPARLRLKKSSVFSQASSAASAL